jgi:hypothetical protein
MRMCMISAILVVATGLDAWARTYTTTFPLTEDPISEGGKWINGRTTGLDWFDAATTSGKVFGEVSTGAYTDPTAILSGSWGPNQDVSAVVYSLNPTASYYQEVELRLRTSIAAHSITGYEVLFRCLKTGSAYCQIVRWNGPVTDFAYTSGSCSGATCGVATGDTVRATIVGNVITAYINGRQIAQATDTTYTSGNPGVGFNYGVGATNADFGFTSYTATDGVTAVSDGRLTIGQHQKAPGGCLSRRESAGSGLCICLTGESRHGGMLRVAILDLFGREVCRVYQGPEVSQVGWDGTDRSGARVPLGLYVVKYSSESLNSAERLQTVR